VDAIHEDVEGVPWRGARPVVSRPKELAALVVRRVEARATTGLAAWLVKDPEQVGRELLKIDLVA
jgi:hypothetical protein